MYFIISSSGINCLLNVIRSLKHSIYGDVNVPTFNFALYSISLKYETTEPFPLVPAT